MDLWTLLTEFNWTPRYGLRVLMPLNVHFVFIPTVCLKTLIQEDNVIVILQGMSQFSVPNITIDSIEIITEENETFITLHHKDEDEIVFDIVDITQSQPTIQQLYKELVPYFEHEKPS